MPYKESSSRGWQAAKEKMRRRKLWDPKKTITENAQTMDISYGAAQTFCYGANLQYKKDPKGIGRYGKTV